MQDYLAWIQCVSKLKTFLLKSHILAQWLCSVSESDNVSQNKTAFV